MILRSLAGMKLAHKLSTIALGQFHTGLTIVLYICSRYTGFYKGVQSAGAAVAWQIDVHNVPFLNELIVSWVLTAISYPLLAVLVIRAVKDDEEVEGKPKEGAALPGIH